MYENVTQEKINYIKENYHHQSVPQMSGTLNLGEWTTRKIVLELLAKGEIKHKNKKWTTEEEIFIIKNHETCTLEDLKEHFGCTLEQIKKKYYRMKTLGLLGMTSKEYLHNRNLAELKNQELLDKIEPMKSEMDYPDFKTVIKYPKLDIGKRYIVSRLSPKGHLRKKEVILDSETEHLYIFQTKNGYRTSISKKDLWINEYQVKEA